MWLGCWVESMRVPCVCPAGWRLGGSPLRFALFHDEIEFLFCCREGRLNLQPSTPSLIVPSPTDNTDLGEAIEAFLKAEKVPAFLEFSQQTSQAIFGSGIPHQVRYWLAYVNWRLG